MKSIITISLLIISFSASALEIKCSMPSNYSGVNTTMIGSVQPTGVIEQGYELMAGVLSLKAISGATSIVDLTDVSVVGVQLDNGALMLRPVDSLLKINVIYIHYDQELLSYFEKEARSFSTACSIE